MSAPMAPSEKPQKGYSLQGLEIMFSTGIDDLSPNDIYVLYKHANELKLALQNIRDGLTQCNACGVWHNNGSDVHCRESKFKQIEFKESSFVIREGCLRSVTLEFKSKKFFNYRLDAYEILESKNWNKLADDLSCEREKCNTIVFDLSKISETDKNILLEMERQYLKK